MKRSRQTIKLSTLTIPTVAFAFSMTLGMLCSSSQVHADDATTLEPLMLTRGKQIFDESFASGIPGTWKKAKGEWEIVKGALQGAELPADKHAAVIRTDFDLPSNYIMQFDFKFDGGKVIHCSFNGKGHICRATLTPSGFTLKGEINKKDPKDKAVMLGQVKQAFEKGQWYTMLLEIQGDEIVARVGKNGPVAFGSHAKVGRPKTNFGFPVAGSNASIDNIKIWAATPNADWAQVKKKLAQTK